MSCVNCQAVTTNDGRTVWVCENCGNENTPSETITPDVSVAQNEISAAAASVADIPSIDIPTTPVVEPTTPAVEPEIPVAPAIPTPSISTFPHTPLSAVVSPEPTVMPPSVSNPEPVDVTIPVVEPAVQTPADTTV